MYVYLLESTNGSTYVGSTVNLDRRLRQHNQEIKGGAKMTSIKVNKGEVWRRHCYIKGFPDWKSCLQFEWRWKQLTRKLSNVIPPLERRMIALDELLHLEQSTTKAVPYKEWETMPMVVYES